MTTPAIIFKLNNKFNAIAPPIISAKSVEMIANSDKMYKLQRNQFGKFSRQLTAKSLPVTLPNLQAKA